jgi:bifunctional DNA-binding transcriptional regulator/antitoxin component of YhaV-PrlF toxin-antitoxin module
MSVVEVDERGRMTIPKEIGLRKAKAAIIPAGSFFVVIPIVGDPYKIAGSWLQTDRDRKELKRAAERRASEDAMGRARRRRQL